MNIPTILLFRAGLAEEEEMKEAARYFPICKQRTALNNNSLIIPRYSALPFYDELEKDLKLQQNLLINTYSQHQYVADIRNWYPDLKDITPATYFNLAEVPSYGPFVLKGATNSRKHLWNTHMYAEDKVAMTQVYSRLMDDTMISEQNIYVRDYVPLKRFATGINGLPITEEYRFFFLGGKVLCGGYYWQNYIDDITEKPDVDKVPWSLLETIANTVSKHINFYVADIARAETGEWLLVELNDGQMSGLSCIEPLKLYATLHYELDRFNTLDKDHLLSYL